MALQAIVVSTPVAGGQQSQIEEPRTVVVRTAAAWEMLRKEHGGSLPQMTDADFSRFMILGVFLGTRATAGYSVGVTGISMRDGLMVVDYREQAPGPDDITAQILTSPFQLIRVQRTEGKVEFRKAGAAAPGR